MFDVLYIRFVHAHASGEKDTALKNTDFEEKLTLNSLKCGLTKEYFTRVNVAPLGFLDKLCHNTITSYTDPDSTTGS